MVRTSFNTGWTTGPKVSIFAQIGGSSDQTPVTLPHDAMIGMDRSATAGAGSHSGYFPGGAVEYRKTFAVPEEYRGKRVLLEFQGVYRDAMVFVNGSLVGQRPNGYATFRVSLDAYLHYGEDNVVRVEARAHHDSRWYTGLGIHRDTVLIVDELTHIAPDGIRINTPDVDDERAVVEIATTVQNQGIDTETMTVATTIRAADGDVAAADTSLVTVRAGSSAVVRQRLYVKNPERWSVEHPVLYSAETSLHDVADEIDRRVTRFGIRTLRLDPERGLRINGETVKLRGACIHHDNGILGAATIARAEERRVELLKAAGFNAIRSAHNPISEAMLEACDRHGMLVMDETFDIWTESKSSFDYSLAFPEWWERDVESMVAKDINHPSVIFYSIGNEIPETGTPLGAALGREMAEKVRSLDPTRLVTNGINGFVSVLPDVIEMFAQQTEPTAESAGVNDAMSKMGDMLNQIGSSPLVTQKTAESHSVLDVAGLNYGDARYVIDRELFPHRVIVGTETFANRIDVNWKLVTDHSHVIGDFTWTGWDYLGEAGIGRTTYPTDDVGAGVGAGGGAGAAWPWLTAWCGDIDITGHRRPVSYYREIVFGLRREPYISVRRPEHYGKAPIAMQWAWSDSLSSWSWDLEPGARVEVEVYSDAEEVELVLNGEPVERRPAGPPHRFIALFDIAYSAGELIAIAYEGGVEQSRTVLRSADRSRRLCVEVDRDVIRADDSDLGYIEISIRDEDGNLANEVDHPVRVVVSGPATLQALGSANPANEERFDAEVHSTFDGRVLAIVRPHDVGTITIDVSCDAFEPVTVEIDAR